MVKIFISYAHLDKDYKDQLEKHLAVLKRNGEIAPWTDKMLVGGETWDQSIIDALNEAELIICLVSSDFLSSDYCYEIEMKGALKRHENKEAIVVPIILRPCDWTSTPFAGLQALPMTGRPIRDWSDMDEAFMNVVEGLRKSIHTIKNRNGESTQEQAHAYPLHEGGGYSANSSGHHYSEPEHAHEHQREHEHEYQHEQAPPPPPRSQLRYALMGAAASFVLAAVFFIAYNSHSKGSDTPPTVADTTQDDGRSVGAAAVSHDKKSKRSLCPGACGEPSCTKEKYGDSCGCANCKNKR